MGDLLDVVAAAVDGSDAVDRHVLVDAQGGDPAVCQDPWSVLPRAPVRSPIPGPGGYLTATDAEALGWVSVFLGAGRIRKGDPIDPAVGFEFLPVVGERLEAGQPVAVVHARDEDSAGEAGRRILGALTFAEEPVAPPPLVYGWHPGEAG